MSVDRMLFGFCRALSKLLRCPELHQQFQDSFSGEQRLRFDGYKPVRQVCRNSQIKGEELEQGKIRREQLELSGPDPEFGD